MNVNLNQVPLYSNFLLILLYLDDFDVAEKKLLKSRKGESIESTDVDQKGKHCRKKKPSIYAALSASQQLERKNCSEEEDDSESDDVRDSDELESSSSSSSDEDDAPLIKAPKPPAAVVQAGQSQEIIDRDDGIFALCPYYKTIIKLILKNAFYYSL